ncbi:MAG: hypothetical protein GX131_02645 [candidate division WS1 bacterium]|jgi:hypothetical protein|nr:hypothetical protein [candidate division WS1 bacterium]
MRVWWKIVGAIAFVTAIALVVALVMIIGRGPREDATPLVEQAVEALDRVSVRGTVVTTARTPEGEVRAEAQVHRGDGRVVMRFLTGRPEGTVVRRQDGAVWVEGREGRIGRRANLDGDGLREQLLERNWSFTSAGTRSVAGRSATLIYGVGPSGRVELALDRETGFPLFISRKGPGGEVISQTIWREADFSAPPPPVQEPPTMPARDRGREVTLAEARAAVDFVVLEPTWLPQGYELLDWRAREGRRGASVVARYGDGLRQMIIVQHKTRAPEERPPQREGRPGRVERPEGTRPRRGDERHEHHAPMRMRGAGGDAVRREFGETTVLVIGPLREADLQRVLDGMRTP